MYKPYVSSSDSGSESDSGSSSSPSVDEQMQAISTWQALRSASAPVPAPAPSNPSGKAADLAIKQTSLEFEEKRHTNVIMINSLDRDQHVYPSPTQLRLKLPRVYKNVERIDIVQVKFFCGLYSISASQNNNTIAFSDPSGSHLVVVPDGAYGLQQLVATVQQLMQAAAPAGGYTAVFNPITGRITLAATVLFSLLFSSSLPVYAQAAYSEWGLGWNLGWGGQPTDLSGGSSYTASHWPRLERDYIYLQMNENEHMNDIDHTDVETTGKSQDSTGQVSHYFGKLLLNHFGCWAQTLIEAPKTFKPVLGRLERLNVVWTDRHGNVLSGVDAESCDWHMTVRIIEIVEAPTANSSLAMSHSIAP